MHPAKPCTTLTPDDSLLMPLHPKERAFIVYLRKLKYGTLHKLVVQDGLPIVAEEVSKTVKF
jgi:hypothetical protein